MKDILVIHGERLDDYYAKMHASREDFEFKMNALIDAQIKNESEISEMKHSITEVKESIIELRIASEELRSASQSQLTRIENLENR